MMKITEREKKFLFIGGVIALLIIGFQISSWYGGMIDKVDNLSDANLSTLRKQLNRIERKEDIIERFEEFERILEKQENAVLRGTKAPVAAAALQKLLKETASSLGVEVRVERAQNPVEMKHYRAIPVEIGFNASTKKLEDLLVRLRMSTFLLTISEIKIRVTNITKPEDVYTTLVVTGYIKNKSMKKMGKNEKDRNAA